MKKKYIIISALLAIAAILIGLKCYDTYRKYGVLEEIYYGVGEPFDYNGLRYELKDMEMYDFDGLVERFGLQDSEEALGETEALNIIKRKYFVATIELTALEENYISGITEMGGYSKYVSGGIKSLFIMQAINGTMTSPQIEVGETIDFYVVCSVTDAYYTEESLEALDADDVYLRILDMSTGQAYCMQKK